MPSDVLDYVREKEPAFKQVDDDTLTEYIADRQPGFLKSDPKFEADHTRIVSTKAGGSLRGVAPGEGPPTPTPKPERLPLIPRTELETRPLEGITPEQMAAQEERLGKPLFELVKPLTDEERSQLSPTQRGAFEGVRDSVNSLTTPTNLGLLATGIGAAKLAPAISKAMAATFAFLMGKQVPEMASELGKEYAKPEKDRDYEKISKLIAEGAVTTGFVAGAAKHGIAEPIASKLGTAAVPPKVADVAAQTMADFLDKAKLEVPEGMVITLGRQVEQNIRQAAPLIPQTAKAVESLPNPLAVGFEKRMGRAATPEELKQLETGQIELAAEEPTPSAPETKPVEPVKPQPKEPSASEIKTPAAVYGDLQSQAGEGKGEVPTDEGGEGVQPQAERGLPETPQPEAPAKQDVLAPDPTWQVTVQAEQTMPDGKTKVPGYVQIDDVSGGKNNWSSNPEALKAKGYEIPDFSKLPPGRYTLAEATKKLTEQAQPISEPTEPTAPEGKVTTTGAESGDVKQPWQMTKSEWRVHEQRATAADFTDEAVTEARRQEVAARKTLDEAIEKRKALGNTESIRKVMTDREGALSRNQARRDADKSIEAARKEFGKWSGRAVGRATHEGYVKRALEAGKPVPPEVLAEYPELKLKAPTPSDVPPGQSVLAKGQEPTPEKVTAEPEKGKRVALGYGGTRKFQAETEAFGPDLLSWINDNMKLLSKSAAKATWGKEKFNLNKSLYDDAVKLESPHYNVIYSDKGFAPDRVAQAAYEAGVLKEPSVNLLWKEIEKSSKSRASAFATSKRESKFMEEEAKAHDDWLKATAEGETRVSGADLKEGDLMEVEGERVEVTKIDADTGDVTLKDGRKFGTQKVGENQVIHVEKFEPSQEGGFEPEPKPEAPKLRPMEKSGELFQGADQPFNLAGEKGTDAERIAVEKAKAERTAEEAKALAEKQQLELTGPGTPAAGQAEFTQEGSVVSNMFAAIDRDRAAMGKPPMEATKARSWDEDNTKALNRMNRDPAWIPDLIKEILKRPRPLLSWENAGLVWHRAKLTAELNNALTRISQAFDGGVHETLAEAKLDAARFEDNLEELDRAVGRGGTGSEAGRTLQAQKMGAGDDFTLVEMRLRKRAAVGGRPLTDAESLEIKQLHEKIDADQKAYNERIAQKDKLIAEQEVKIALDKIALEAKKEPTIPPHIRIIADKVKGYFDQRADAALKRLSGKVFTLSPQVLADLTDLGVSRILSGAIEFGEWSVKMGEALGEKVKPHLKTVWDAAHEALDKQIARMSGYQTERTEKVKKAVKGIEITDKKEKLTKSISDKFEAGKRQEITMLVQKLARLFVEEGIKERDLLIDAVHGVLKDIDPEFTRRDTMDAISGYGQFKQLRKDEISKQLRDLKGQMQQVAKLEDMQAGQPPLKTGLERRIPSAEESRLIKLVNEAKREFQIPISDPETQLRSSLDELKKRMSTRLDELNEKMRTGDFTKRPKREITLDPEAQRLKAEYERTKLRFERMLMQDRLRNRSWPEKAMDTFVKWRRGFVLSSPITLGKLTAAAATRLASSLTEEAIGGGISQVIPGVAERAPREGGFSTRAEAKALTQTFTQGMRDAWKTLKTGQSDLDVLYGGKFDPSVGEGLVLDKSVVDYIGQSHGMLKAPVKRAEFERSLQKRIEHAISSGQDMSDPLVMMRAATEAYKDANRSIFLQDNAVVDMWKRAMTRLEQPEKGTGRVPLGRKIAATTARTLVPIVKVPTNIVAETLQYSTGLFSGGIRLGRALYKGVENLKPEEADLIMRQLKKGSIGGALMLTGYLLPNQIGGFYQHGMKRDKKDVKVGGIRIGDVELPYWMLHNPLLNTLQIGATIRRVADSKLRKKDKEPQRLTAGVIAGGLGLAEETPFVREAYELAKAMNPHDRAAFFGETAKGIMVPQVLQWAAKKYDVDAKGNLIERKPSTVLEHIETGIPGLREEVPKRK